ncbi:TetR/AcrR family transcriptional regulator [Cohnella fermenti]|uniref:TetR/AcrR family transcriptional regulator n=1 Tax=Cohnella fermenti TaxID=2565925 RepID=A0A4S4BM79_9BACL|nr:TetR/AcrR family transcriptional regulator [Cohnella fermenti]THF75726.1 TetR/AcrR family transcriptional regulator [Cohnella fermenti]
MFGRYNKVQQAVLETTLRLIIDKELQATSMSLIAKESKVSTGNIYHYFSSKEDIINELYKAIVQFNGEYVTKNWHEGDGVKERFERAWTNFIKLSLAYPQGFQFIEQYSFSPYIYEQSKLDAYETGWCAPMEALYEEAIGQKMFVELEPRLMVQMSYGSLVYAVKAHLQNRVELDEPHAKQIVAACWNSFAKA